MLNEKTERRSFIAAMFASVCAILFGRSESKAEAYSFTADDVGTLRYLRGGEWVEATGGLDAAPVGFDSVSYPHADKSPCGCVLPELAVYDRAIVWVDDGPIHVGTVDGRTADINAIPFPMSQGITVIKIECVHSSDLPAITAALDEYFRNKYLFVATS
jgi:hypothetical protein